MYASRRESQESKCQNEKQYKNINNRKRKRKEKFEPPIEQLREINKFIFVFPSM